MLIYNFFTFILVILLIITLVGGFCIFYTFKIEPYRLKVNEYTLNRNAENTLASLTTLVAIANILTVSVNTLLCDTVLTSKVVFEREVSEIFEDSNAYEVRVLVDVLKTNEQSLQTVKMFEDKLNENRQKP